MIQWKRHWPLYLMLLPYLAGLLLLVFIPALISLAFVFSDYNALSSPQWAGLENIKTLFNDRLAWIAVANTLFYIILVALLRLIGAFGLALLLQRRALGIGVYRSVVFMPTIIPQVAYALLWLVLFNPRFGPINLFLGVAGLPSPAWLIDPWPTRLALIIMAVWQLGEGFVILLVSLADVPAGLYQAAELDGAGNVAKFRYITLPLLLPRLLLLSARDLILAAHLSFVPALVITGGGPGYATLFVPLYAYFLAFEDFRFGYAATLTWFMSLITAAIIFVPYLLTRRSRYEGSY